MLDDLKKSCKEICVYFDANHKITFFEQFAVLSKYSNDVCKRQIMIAFYATTVALSFDCRQLCHKVIKIIL